MDCGKLKKREDKKGNKGSAGDTDLYMVYLDCLQELIEEDYVPYRT
jgi:hypothetical protein